MSERFDTIIIGGNFCGMAAAYGLQQQGERVQIIEAAGKLGGFMAPLVRGAYQLDKGPQFLDNFNDRDRSFIDALLDEDMLEDIGFAYASYNQGKLTEDFAVPDWRSLGKERAREVFFELLQERIDPGYAARAQDMRTFRDVCTLDGGAQLGPILEQYCQKLLQVAAEDIAPQAATLVTFLGRKLLFDQDISVALKVAPTLDDLLVARKHSFGETMYNLYPKGRNLETLRARMASRMDTLGITCTLGNAVADVAKTANGVAVTTADGSVHQGGRILIAADIRLAESMLLGTKTLTEATHFLPQIFYFFIVNRADVHPSFYIQDYDLGHRVTRITNMANYMGSAAGGDKGVVCAEVPANKDDPYWLEPAAHVDSVWQEVRETGAVTSDHHDAWAAPVPVTYRVGRAHYPPLLAKALDEIGSRYGDAVLVPETNRLTRQQALAALRDLDVIKD